MSIRADIVATYRAALKSGAVEWTPLAIANVFLMRSKNAAEALKSARYVVTYLEKLVDQEAIPLVKTDLRVVGANDVRAKGAR